MIELLIALVLFLGSLALLAWATRGRKEPVPPTCRRCGYDVSQRAEDSEECSECGADLRGRRAIITVRRRARPVATGLAILLVLVTGPLFIVPAAFFPWGPWLRSNSPTWWIVRSAQRDLGTSGDAYRRAWRDRVGNSSEFFDHLLDVQAGTVAPFSETWDYILAEAYEAGTLTQAQKDRYLTQMFSPPVEFRTRNPVRIGDPLLLSLSAPKRGKFGDRSASKITVAAKVGAPPELDPNRLWSFGRQQMGTTRDIPFHQWADGSLTPGKHALHVAVRRELAESYDKPWSQPFDSRAELMIDVLPRDAKLGTAKPDPAKADEVAREIDVDVFHWHDGRCFARVRLRRGASVDRAFTIFAVIDGREEPIGIVAAKAGQEDSSDHIYVPISVEQAKATQRMSIVLVGDGEALKTTLDQQEYWPGRIEYLGVPLRPYTEAHADAPAVHLQAYRVVATE